MFLLLEGVPPPVRHAPQLSGTPAEWPVPVHQSPDLPAAPGLELLADLLHVAHRREEMDFSQTLAEQRERGTTRVGWGEGRKENMNTGRGAKVLPWAATHTVLTIKIPMGTFSKEHFGKFPKKSQ